MDQLVEHQEIKYKTNVDWEQSSLNYPPDCIGTDIESLNLHIATCEIYTCEDCNYRTKHLHDIKEHLNIKHEKQTYHEIIHAKINRKDPEVIDHDIHIKYQICS